MQSKAKIGISAFTLAGATHVGMYTWIRNKCPAFTLAEVLVTIGIIGVVASMTLPGAIGNWQKKVHVNKMKHTYSVMQNALMMSFHENGNPKEWYWGNDVGKENLTRFVETYIIPYLNLSAKNTKRPGQYQHYYSAQLRNGTTLLFVLDGCTNPETCNPVSVSTLNIIVSTSGNVMPIAHETRDYSRKDFILKLQKTGKFGFFNTGGSTREGIKNNATYGCNMNVVKNKRYNCGALIFYDNWEILGDYPW